MRAARNRHGRLAGPGGCTFPGISRGFRGRLRAKAAQGGHDRGGSSRWPCGRQVKTSHEIASHGQQADGQRHAAYSRALSWGARHPVVDPGSATSRTLFAELHCYRSSREADRTDHEPGVARRGDVMDKQRGTPRGAPVGHGRLCRETGPRRQQGASPTPSAVAPL